MRKVNPILSCDFYKISHANMFPEGTTKVYSNFTPRSSKLARKLEGIFDDKIVFFGLQGFIKEVLIDQWNEGFFGRPEDEAVGEYTQVVTAAVGSADTERVRALHRLGYLPIKIKALPEGSLVNMKVPVLTITNTLPEFYWLPNYLETVLSAELWKMSTSATTAYQYRKLLEQYAEKTGGAKDFVLWQGHDFSFRGMSSTNDAAMSGAAHLTSFLGTDTIPAIAYLNQYYKGNQTFVAGSVPASEHSVTTGTIQALVAKGMTQREAEKEFVRHMIQDKYPSGIVSLVADSFDYWDVVSRISAELKDVIEARQPDALGNAKVVFRPDSGDPVEIICGTDSDIINLDNEREVSDFLSDGTDGDRFRYEGKVYEIVNLESFKQDYSLDCWMQLKSNIKTYLEQGLLEEVTLDYSSPEVKGSIETLWDIFGGTINEKGYKVLNPRVGLIYGDSITLERAQEIMKRLEAKGFASTNVVFGIGSYTYQCVTRDSFGFAMKATYIEVDGKGVEVFKDPKTDNGTKKSARGLLRVEKEGNDYVLYDQQTEDKEREGELDVVFIDGWLAKSTTLAEVRERINNSLK